MGLSSKIFAEIAIFRKHLVVKMQNIFLFKIFLFVVIFEGKRKLFFWMSLWFCKYFLQEN
jgi:hypothetical protein